MAIKRVLTVESVDESTTRKMLKTIYGSSEFKDYIIEHFFFLGEDKDTIDKKELFNNLNSKIKKFKPDAILIHAGGYFLKNEEAFLYAIPKLKAEHSNILFGIQCRANMDNEIVTILDDS